MFYLQVVRQQSMQIRLSLIGLAASSHYSKEGICHAIFLELYSSRGLYWLPICRLSWLSNWPVSAPSTTESFCTNSYKCLQLLLSCHIYASLLQKWRNWVRTSKLHLTIESKSQYLDAEQEAANACKVARVIKGQVSCSVKANSVAKPTGSVRLLSDMDRTNTDTISVHDRDYRAIKEDYQNLVEGEAPFCERIYTGRENDYEDIYSHSAYPSPSCTCCTTGAIKTGSHYCELYPRCNAYSHKDIFTDTIKNAFKRILT